MSSSPPPRPRSARSTPPRPTQLRKRPGAVVLDVRGGRRVRAGRHPRRCSLPCGTLETGIESRVPDKSTPLIVHCAGGTRSAFAAKSLADLGYTDVVSRRRWLQQVEGRRSGVDGAPQPHARPAQPLPAPPAAARGRRRRSAASCSTPRSSCSAPAASAPRRPLPRRRRRRHHRHHRHGRGRRLQPPAPDPPQPGARSASARSTSAKKTLTGINPDVNVVTYDVRLGADNVEEILGDGGVGGWDVIVDGTDNFPTRYLVNDTSVKFGIPVIHGSIFRFEGMVTVFDPEERPDLPRHGPRAAAGGDGPELRRGRRARRAARHRRVDPGHRDDQAVPRPRRPR